MADIKTRQVNKGSVKTIDRAANLSGRLRDTTVRTKEGIREHVGRDDRNESAYATDSTVHMAERGVKSGGQAVRKGAQKTYRAISTKKYAQDVRTKERFVKRAKDAKRAAGAGSQSSRSGTVSAGAKVRSAQARNAGGVSAAKKMQSAKQAKEFAQRSQIARKTAEQTARNTKRAVKAMVRSIKRTILATKTLVTALSAAGATAVLIILICVLLCSALFFFGDETSDDYLTATGDSQITQVAASQIGNHGGRKFWRWYGFSERVDWCAIFVSWCADKCGYIESGVIPKFSFVPSGVDWFVERGQFRPNSYIPKPGDIIFIDWGGDGTRDHVGIVEKCDGKTVYTIEGNSGNVCKRQSYIVGGKTIFGYGVPKYPDNKSNKYEMAGHGMTEVSDQTEDSPFEHIHRSGKKMCFLKIWTDPDGRYGAKDFSALEEQSMKMNPFYDNDYFLFSIHRFRDSMWEISKRYDNVHLIEARYLSF